MQFSFCPISVIDKPTITSILLLTNIFIMAAHICHVVPPYILHDIAEGADPEASRRATETLESMTHFHDIRQGYFQAKLAHGHHGGHSALLHNIVPDYVLDHITDAPDVDEATRQNAAATLAANTRLREQRAAGLEIEGAVAAPSRSLAPFIRSVYDMEQSTDASTLPGNLVRAESQEPVEDQAANEVYDNCYKVLEFYRENFDYDSLNGQNMPVVSSVHFGVNYQNASWIGVDPSATPPKVYNQMIYGDGADPLFNFTKSLDVIGHEMTVESSPRETVGQ
jgi:hypothetical protein